MIIKKIILHCSDFAGPHDITDITQWHIARGFVTCGYHYVITQDGDIQIGRSENEMGAHVKGHNKDSIGICLCGKTHFTDTQFIILKRLLTELMLKYKGAKLYGHYEFDKNKTCPNIDMNWLRSHFGNCSMNRPELKSLLFMMCLLLLLIAIMNGLME